MCQSSPCHGIACFVFIFILSVFFCFCFIAHPFYWHSCTVNKSIFVPILKKITVCLSLIKQWLQQNHLCCCRLVKHMLSVWQYNMYHFTDLLYFGISLTVILIFDQPPHLCVSPGRCKMDMTEWLEVSSVPLPSKDFFSVLRLLMNKHILIREPNVNLTLVSSYCN